MTATVTNIGQAPSRTGHSQDPAPAAAPAGAAELLDVDPKALIIGANVRLDPRLDKDFIGSIRERGVLDPPIAYRDDEGRLVVVRGQRRTLAAVETGRPSIRVVVDAKPAEDDRLVDQLAENHHRAGLTTHEDTVAYQQLAAIGVPAGQIAKRTARPKATIDAALAVAASKAASKATQEHASLTLEQAAGLAEFDNDKRAVEALLTAAIAGHNFKYQLQCLRDERDMAAEKAQVTAELEGQGAKVVDRPPYDHPKIKALDALKIGNKDATKANHRKCPGHVVFLGQKRVDRKDGPGMRMTWEPDYACTDWKGNGHTLRYPALHGASGRLKPEDMSPEEREAATAERRDVRESNKAWDAATKVRHDWLKEFAARKAAPKTAAAYIAKAIASCDHQIRGAMEGSHKLARDLFGVEHETYKSDHRRGQLLADLCTTEARSTMVTLVMILAAYEENVPRDAWRRSDPGVTEYLRYIESEGYELADVEKRACGEKATTPAEPE